MKKKDKFITPTRIKCCSRKFNVSNGFSILNIYAPILYTLCFFNIWAYTWYITLTLHRPTYNL